MRLTRVTALLALAFLGCTELSRLHASPHPVFFAPPFRFRGVGGVPAVAGFFQSFWKLADLTDSIGSLTLTNSATPVTFSAGKIGNAGNFANAKFLTRPNFVVAGPSFTFVCWFKHTTGTSADNLVTFGSGAGSFNISISALTGNGKLYFYTDGTAANPLISSAAYNDNAYHLLVAWHSVTDHKNHFVIDNGVQQDGTATNDVAGATTTLGLSRTASGNNWNGQIDAAGIADNKVPTAAQITALWGGGNGVEPPF